MNKWPPIVLCVQRRRRILWRRTSPSPARMSSTARTTSTGRNLEAFNINWLDPDPTKTIKKLKITLTVIYTHTKQWIWAFFKNNILKSFLVLDPFLPGSGSVTNFFTSWIRIRFKMIRIRHTGCSSSSFLVPNITGQNQARRSQLKPCTQYVIFRSTIIFTWYKIY